MELDGHGPARAYVSPAAGGGRAGVVVIHEIEGLTPHFANLCERLSETGYSAVAPDLFARDPRIPESAAAGDYPTALTRIYELGPERLAADLRAARDTLVTSCYTDVDRVAVLGFCVGGYVTLLAATDPAGGWAAAAAFYGPPAGYGPLGLPADPSPLARAAELSCPTRLFYGQRDDLIPSDQPLAFAAAAKRSGHPVDVVLEDAGHAFFNDSRETYVPAAAAHAWTELLDFLGRNLPDER